MLAEADVKATFNLAKNPVCFRYVGEIPTPKDVLKFAEVVFHKRPDKAVDDFIAHLNQQNKMGMNEINISHLLVRPNSILQSAYPDLDYIVDLSTFDIDKFRTEPWWSEECLK